LFRDREGRPGAAVGLVDFAAFKVDDSPAALAVDDGELVAGLARAVDRVCERRFCFAWRTRPEVGDPGDGAANRPPRRLREACELVGAAPGVPREDDVAGHVPMDGLQGGDTGVDGRGTVR
jgi:hypothetical protein